MKTINPRTIVALGALLAVTVAIGCFDGGSGYSNQPYGYDGNRSYSQSYGNSYNAGYRDGVRADEIHTTHQNQYDNDKPDRRVVVSRDHDDQGRTEKHTSSGDHDDHSKNDSQWAPPSQRN